jgi:hypothetical protein
MIQHDTALDVIWPLEQNSLFLQPRPEVLFLFYNPVEVIRPLPCFDLAL